MAGHELDLYEALLGEADDELYAWVAGREPAPERYAGGHRGDRAGRGPPAPPAGRE